MTEVPIWTRSVRSPSAASQASENGAWPPWWRHGWKWSEMNTLSSPSSSASTPKSSSSRGANCSAEALYPMRSVMAPPYAAWPKVLPRTGERPS